MRIQERRGALKTRCPSYCLRCLRIIPPLVVGLANWLSTSRLPVFGVPFQEERRLSRASLLRVRGREAFPNSLCVSFCVCVCLPPARLSGILNFNTSLLEFFTQPLSYKKSTVKRRISLGD